MHKRAKSKKPSPKKKDPNPFTLEWLDKIEELYEDYSDV